MEHKLNAILQHLVMSGLMEVPDTMDGERMCSGCGGIIKWKPSAEGYPVTKCECKMPIAAVDYTIFTPPTKKEIKK
jgi:uncharacterized protein YceK